MIPQVCAVNFKKASGGAVANSNKISEAILHNKKPLKKPFALYKPDITILCGTETYDQNVVENNPNWQMTLRGIWYDINDGMMVISYSHPEARTKECFLPYR